MKKLIFGRFPDVVVEINNLLGQGWDFEEDSQPREVVVTGVIFLTCVLSRKNGYNNLGRNNDEETRDIPNHEYNKLETVCR